MSIVPAEVWVVANFKESQLKKMKPGQPVRVSIDALGGREFAAHVDSVQAGSGAQFSLLPPENATGNFVKVIQRVPVKIVFDDAVARGSRHRPRAFRDAQRAGEQIHRAVAGGGSHRHSRFHRGGIDLHGRDGTQKRQRLSLHGWSSATNMATAP